MAQDDLLIEELSVYQNLYYNARLCFDNYTEEQLISTVDSTLANLGLYVGITSQQIWASGWAPADADTTPELELVALRDYQQLGIATGFTLRGKVHKLNRPEYSGVYNLIKISITL